MVFRLTLTYNDKEYILHDKHIGPEDKSLSSSNGIYEVRGPNNTSKAILPKNVDRKRYYNEEKKCYDFTYQEGQVVDIHWKICFIFKQH